MNAKWLYITALLLLPLIRVLVLNMDLDKGLHAAHYDGAANFIALLRDSPAFLTYIGNWALLVFVASVLVFWMTEQDNADVPKQFLLLPIAYVPFCIVGTILKTAEFQLWYFYVYPLIILPVGYLYISFWVLIVWLLEKIGLVQ